MVLYELDVVDGLFQLEGVFLSDGRRHVVEGVVYGRHGRVDQPAGRARGGRPVAAGPAANGHEPAQRIGGRTVAGRRRRNRGGWHVQRGANARRVQPTRVKQLVSVTKSHLGLQV